MRAATAGTRGMMSSGVVPARPTTAKCAASSTPGNSCHVAMSANASAPMMKKICDGRQPSPMQCLQRGHGVGRALPLQFEITGRQTGIAVDRQRQQREAVERPTRAARPADAAGRSDGRSQDFVQRSWRAAASAASRWP